MLKKHRRELEHQLIRISDVLRSFRDLNTEDLNVELQPFHLVVELPCDLNSDDPRPTRLNILIDKEKLYIERVLKGLIIDEKTYMFNDTYSDEIVKEVMGYIDAYEYNNDVQFHPKHSEKPKPMTVTLKSGRQITLTDEVVKDICEIIAPLMDASKLPFNYKDLHSDQR